MADSGCVDRPCQRIFFCVCFNCKYSAWLNHICVCVCVCVCVCIMYACVCVGVCVCVCMCLCLFLLLQTHLTYICSSNMLPKGRWRIKTHVHVPTHNHKWTNTHTHMQAHTPAHKNPHTPTHTHTCATVKCPRVEAKQGEKEPSENKQKD